MKIIWIALLSALSVRLCEAADCALIVVEDLGGAAARPYYEALRLTPPEASRALRPPGPSPRRLHGRYSEADLLPVRSRALMPGVLTPRTHRAPGFPPLFLIGDDALSRKWLARRRVELRRLRAVGWIVQVESAEAVASLRQLAPDLMLVPVSGDDLARRLRIKHYPVLITATTIEQ